MGKLVYISHWAHMGLLSGPTLVHYGRAHMDLSVWVLYGRAHMGKPVYIKHGAHMGLLSG